MNVVTPHIAPANIDGFVNFVLEQLKSKTQEPQDLLSLGAKNEFSQLIELLLIDPFSFNIDALKRNHAELLKYVEIYVMAYLKAKKELIFKLYKYQTATGINYFISLNKDSTENREVFFQLLDHYESLKINDYPHC